MQELILRYLAGPALLRESLAGLSEVDLTYKYDPAKWSAKEIAIHIVDMDLVGAFRMKRIIAEPGARYPGVDQDRWAAALGYQGRALEPALLLLEAVRREMGEALAALPAAAWERSGVHEEAGQQSLPDAVTKYAGHLEHHVRQIRAIRQRLGR